MLVGTVEYMSPEQARGDALDTRSDLFSLGAVLYEMATGWPPFRGSTLAATVDAVLNRAPVSPTRLKEDLPRGLGAVIEKALEKDRELRYQHASEIRADLQGLKAAGGADRAPALEGASEAKAGAPVPGPARRLRGWSRPRKAVLLSAIGALAALALAAWLLAPRPTARTRPLRLAVLPFANLTGDPDREYLSDGLTDELITDLGRLPDLGVIARTTVMKYKRSPKGVGQVGRELGVDFVLEGSVRQAEKRLRVTAQLIRASDETHVWAETYDREASGVLAIQGDVARSVAREIQMRLPPPTSPHRPLPEAHLAYLRGRYESDKRTETPSSGASRISRRPSGRTRASPGRTPGSRTATSSWATTDTCRRRRPYPRRGRRQGTRSLSTRASPSRLRRGHRLCRDRRAASRGLLAGQGSAAPAIPWRSGSGSSPSSRRCARTRASWSRSGRRGSDAVAAGESTMIGRTVSHYLVEEDLGRGTGEVYKAVDTGLGRPVALRFLAEGLARDPRALESFRRAAGAASTLNHPGICTVYSIDSHEGRPFIVTEFLAGKRWSAASEDFPSPWPSCWRSRSRWPTRWRPRTCTGSSTAASGPGASS